MFEIETHLYYGMNASKRIFININAESVFANLPVNHSSSIPQL